MIYAISPSLLLLGWMAVVSCLLVPAGVSHGEAATVLASVVTSMLGLLFEAGLLEAGEARGKRARDTVLQLLALIAFCARLIAFGWRSFS